MSASSSRSSASTSAKRPELLVDRSLGAVSVPRALAGAGFVVHTINDIFGVRPVEDVEWMDYAGQHDLVVACKDERIRRRPAELAAFRRNSLRVLCLTNGHLRVHEQVAYFLDNISRIDKLWHEDGPWMFGIYKDRIDRLHLGL